jgi:hypothetical protein
MATFIGYTGTHKMEPREGLNYSTTYVKQTRAQRDLLVKHCRRVLEEIADAIEGNEELLTWATEPLVGFPRKNLPNRSVSDIISDMIQECQGKRSNGTPKDFALAPIERWNKLFGDTEYAIVLERHIEEEYAP